MIVVGEEEDETVGKSRHHRVSQLGDGLFLRRVR